jgi:uncharacterized surface protein with fasciclin (FAS1) repeats
MKRKFLAVIGLGLVAAVAVPAVAPASAATRPTLAQILLSDSKKDAANGFDANPNDFDIVTQAVLAFPDLVTAASSPGNLTVFLPTDYAFRRLLKDLTGTTIRKESDIFNAVVGLGLPTVEAVLKYHILGTRVDYATALKADGASLTTLGGGTITVDVTGRVFKRVVLQDMDPDLRDPKVVVANIRASNGIAHAIDRVLLPVNL